jgi:hypothetical protein
VIASVAIALPSAGNAVGVTLPEQERLKLIERQRAAETLPWTDQAREE